LEALDGQRIMGIVVFRLDMFHEIYGITIQNSLLFASDPWTKRKTQKNKTTPTVLYLSAAV
jgi:hypothetical protein